MYVLLCFTDYCVSGHNWYKHLSKERILIINKSKLDNIYIYIHTHIYIYIYIYNFVG
jgi:hypothetical protein